MTTPCATVTPTTLPSICKRVLRDDFPAPVLILLGKAESIHLSLCRTNPCGIALPDLVEALPRIGRQRLAGGPVSGWRSGYHAFIRCLLPHRYIAPRCSMAISNGQRPMLQYR